MQQVATKTKTKIFFPNLDGLRFISFFVVFLYHCYISFFGYLQESSPETYGVFEFLFKNGNLGVNFFFVLSGFLITYLLIKEKDLQGSIHVGNFYVRRILRIWPLYYLCLAIGFIVFPFIKKMGGELPYESANPFYYAFFAANFDYMHTWPEKPNALLLSVLWSVAVEEQFYLTWPVLLGLIPLRKYKFVFPAIMLLSLVFRSFYTECNEADHAVRYFHTFSLIGDMALGGLFAYFSSYENRFKDFFVNMSRPAIILLYIATLAVTLLREYIFVGGAPVVFERVVIALLFGMIIMEQNYAKHSLFKMGNLKTMSKLGTYTYGLYCLHLLGMYAAVKVVEKFRLDPTSVGIALLSAVIALILSIIISIASYHFFEKWFLKIKSRFSVIVTK
jgi:peptidoglycan/LPS O-acetylase OafA/YrhL